MGNKKTNDPQSLHEILLFELMKFLNEIVLDYYIEGDLGAVQEQNQVTLNLSFESYANKYENIELKRNDGVLEVFFGSKTVLTWDRHLSDSLIELFGHIRDDPLNVIVILNGRDEFF